MGGGEKIIEKDKKIAEKANNFSGVASSDVLCINSTPLSSLLSLSVDHCRDASLTLGQWIEETFKNH